MNDSHPGPSDPGPARSRRFQRWRSRIDRLTRSIISLGGLLVICAVALIFFYLLYVVYPLFLPADGELQELSARSGETQREPLYLTVEEQLEVGARIDSRGVFEFFLLADGSAVTPSEDSLLPQGLFPQPLVAVQEAQERNGLLAVLDQSGDLRLLKLGFVTRFDPQTSARRILPELSWPYGSEPVMQLEAQAIEALVLSDSDVRLAVVALMSDGGVQGLRASQSENFLTGETQLETELFSATAAQLDAGFVQAMAIAGNHSSLYLGDASGRVHHLALPSLQSQGVHDLQGGAIRSMTMLLGGISILAGTERGQVNQVIPVRDGNNQVSLATIRQFQAGDSPIRKIVTEHRRKGFLALNEESQLYLFHSTSGRELLDVSLQAMQPRYLAIAPRANGLLVEGANGSMSLLELDNPHPEVSIDTLWRKVWYENYSQPEYVWQSSAATTDFEPKFSLTPLVFGTLKAALYAMLFAVPLALLGAIYTAYFMAPELRAWVKPGLEVMEALPTVILGFLAGLWFAPWVEENLAGIFAILLLLPPGVLLAAWLWHRYGQRYAARVPAGYEAVLLLPLLAGLIWLAVGLAVPLQDLLFGGDLRQWLTVEAGIEYDQRNALVVGCAMGFAVVPNIFSIAEDAVFGVPKSLSNGSLALGATPWQTLTRVVLPTASPGIFSALMIGLGRAVGETMIVLMATGNTPLMEWSLFEGMRTLAANIAVELPESEVASTHYRVLFLAALVLFLFTFVLNTVAEVVRQRLRGRYSSL